jgi:uncharacterized protein (TIGR00369 family)
MNLDQLLLRQYQSGEKLPASIKTSPLAEALETRIEKIEETGPCIELSFAVGERFVQAEDVVHGGAVATMLDSAMAYVALLAIPDGLSVATINMNVSCIRSARPGHFTAVAEIERCGKSVVFTRARLLDRENKIVATAVSSLAIVAPRRGLAQESSDGAEGRAPV